MSIGVCIGVYITAICVANIVAATFGPWVTPFSAFTLIALDMVIRDKLHDLWESKVLMRMPTLICAAAIISYVVNPSAGTVGVASLISFTVAGFVDASVYHLCVRRSWFQRCNISNVFGAATDSVVFPYVAFGVVLPGVVLGQFVAKLLGGVLLSVLLIKYNSRSKL